VRLPALARTLARLAQQGPREFYEGELAERLAAGLAAAGSPLRLADLRATQARCEAPLRLPYRQGELLTIAPPTQGMTTLQAMGILSHWDLRQVPEGGAQHYHRVVEAIKRAFIDRDLWLADPDVATVPVADLLAPDYLQRLAAGVSLEQALPWPHRYQTGDTVYIAVADGQGRCVSLLQTIYYDWGSGVVAGDTGVLWHNRGAAFHPDPAHRNGLQAGKRPFHTSTPASTWKGAGPGCCTAPRGGWSAADAGDAADAPDRPWAGPAGGAAAAPLPAGQDLLGQPGQPEAGVRRGRRRDGHPAPDGPRGSADRSPERAGGPAGVIRLGADGWLEGAHDPRSEGLALGL
jgi:gamma-glutamyltranspeptidase/glutathione hydrolase